VCQGVRVRVCVCERVRVCVCVSIYLPIYIGIFNVFGTQFTNSSTEISVIMTDSGLLFR
jgi:hypothetical protein